MKVFISSDMEGTAGIVDWAQCRGPSQEYELGRRLLQGEVNAAIEGAIQGGATEVLVNDSHGAMANLDPAALGGEAAYLSGRHKPLYMMEGLDASYGAILFVSYHGSMGSPGTLSHTYNPRAVSAVRLGGTPTGEAGINALVAAAHRVPVALVTGDQVAAAEAAPFLPGAAAVVVKRSITRFAAESLHPAAACRAIRDGAAEAVARAAAGEVPVPAPDLPCRLEVDWLTADMAEMATWVRGVERTAERGTAVTDDDPLRLYRTFVTCVYLTRSLVE
ncbi:MAG: M55 family metallopeptidase [Acidimicrobiales bacterium]